MRKHLFPLTIALVAGLTACGPTTDATTQAAAVETLAPELTTSTMLPPQTTSTTATTRPPTTTSARVTTTARPTPVATSAAPAASAASGGCHPSYGGCVPVASDVDCAGGSGNGPAYTSAKNIPVTGPDVYGLDRDGNGLGCES